MSWTVAYSGLRRLDEETRETEERPPHILDLDGFDEVFDIRDIPRDLAVTEEREDRSSYPHETYLALHGFRTWQPSSGIEHLLEEGCTAEDIDERYRYSTYKLGMQYNIERLGMPYESVDGEWSRFFSDISEHTEPFAFYVSPIEDRFPDLTDIGSDGVKCWYVECIDGELKVVKQTYEMVDEEVEVDETKW